MITGFSNLMIGFSIIGIFLSVIVYWFVFKAFEKTWLSKIAFMLMMTSLVLIQLHHWQWFSEGQSVFKSHFYSALLFISAPGFYFFSRELLQFNTRNHPVLLLHFLPLAISPWLNASIAIPLGFAIGSCYAFWLCLIIFRLRNQQKYFHLEFLTFAVFAVSALLIFIFGVLVAWIGERWFVITYANTIGIAIFIILFLQLRFPDIVQKTSDAVAANYAASTLKNADCDALVNQIKKLLEEQKSYRNENLSLSGLADELQLSAHQTSELINTYFNMGFPRLIREYRVSEAKDQLINEPKASVLSIGLAVGFTSQSNFYLAFKELTGETPGQFRKRMGITTI